MSAGVHACGADASFTDVKIKPQIGNSTRGCGWRHAPEAWAENFLGFEKKQWVEFLPPNERVEIQSWAKPDEFVCYGCRALVGLRADDVKAVSSCRKTFKLKKVNKSFVPEPISWMLCISDSLCTFPMFVSWSYVFGPLYYNSCVWREWERGFLWLDIMIMWWAQKSWRKIQNVVR